MNLYWDSEQEKNSWGYGDDIGIISKESSSSKKDKEQDEQIDANKEEINKTKESLEENNQRDDAQQSQIDELTDRLNRNIESDAAQQAQIDENATQINSNKTEIIRVESELPTLEMDGTMLVIGKKGNS